MSLQCLCPLQLLTDPFTGAFGLVWYVPLVPRKCGPPFLTTPPIHPSSAKDQLTGSSVAIKKIMKPFSTPVLSKRTYRELKLLKHIQHENVRLLFPPLLCSSHSFGDHMQIISLNDVFISPLEDMYDVFLRSRLTSTY